MTGSSSALLVAATLTGVVDRSWARVLGPPWFPAAVVLGVVGPTVSLAALGAAAQTF